MRVRFQPTNSSVPLSPIRGSFSEFYEHLVRLNQTKNASLIFLQMFRSFASLSMAATSTLLPLIGTTRATTPIPIWISLCNFDVAQLPIKPLGTLDCSSRFWKISKQQLRAKRTMSSTFPPFQSGCGMRMGQSRSQTIRTKCFGRTNRA